MTEDPHQAPGREAVSGRARKPRPTDGFEKRLRKIRVLGDADDPLFFVGISALAAGTVIALLASLLLHHGHEFRDVTFKLAGGALVALGAYTAARTIVSNRGSSASQSFTSVLALLADDPATANAARIGAIIHLPNLARSRGADAVAIAAVIEQLLKSDSTRVRDAAVVAHLRFPRSHEQRAPDHRQRPYS